MANVPLSIRDLSDLRFKLKQKMALVDKQIKFTGIEEVIEA